MKLAWYVAHIGHVRNACKIFGRKFAEERFRCKGNDNGNSNLKAGVGGLL
jgi:hypothetical protein